MSSVFSIMIAILIGIFFGYDRAQAIQTGGFTTPNMWLGELLVTGFLGSGKTTFLKRLLRNTPEDLKIAVIQNEFAPSNVDGEELMQSTDGAFELLEINNGSVFCVCLLGTFVRSLSEFMDVHHPDVVIMEASGLSDPAGIAELFQSDILSKKVFFKEAWCIVDAAHFGKIERMKKKNFFLGQIFPF